MQKTLLVIALSFVSMTAFAAPQAARPNRQMQAVLDAQQELNPLPIVDLTPDQARQQPTMADAVKHLLDGQKRVPNDQNIAKVADITLDGAAGSLPARVYTPVVSAQPMPVVLYFHGGGFVISTIDAYDASARVLARRANAIVVSVEYRKGPENKFPAAHDDAIASYKWILANAASFGGDASHVAVAGESAGGNLALNVAIAARDQHLQAPTAVLAVYPLVSGNTSLPSYTTYADAKPLSTKMVTWFSQNYLADMNQAQDPRINVLGANLAGLPDTMIIAAQIDPLLSEGRMLAKKMKAAGVDVDYELYRGVTHEFFGMGDVVRQARNAEAEAADFLADSFD